MSDPAAIISKFQVFTYLSKILCDMAIATADINDQILALALVRLEPVAEEGISRIQRCCVISRVV